MKRVRQSPVQPAAFLFVGVLCLAILLLLKAMQSLAALIPR
jgi:hypothetical protein